MLFAIKINLNFKLLNKWNFNLKVLSTALTSIYSICKILKREYLVAKFPFRNKIPLIL